MTIDEKLARAHKNFLRLREEQVFSLEPREGILAIAVSYALGKQIPVDYKTRISFREEAEALKNDASRHPGGPYASVEIHDDIDRDGLDRIVVDPEVAGVITIGHGSANCLYVHGRSNHTWESVASRSLHLKRGWVMQRTCALVHSFESVPWGTFLLEDQRKLLLAAGKLLPDHELVDDDLMKPVYSNKINEPNQIKEVVKHVGKTQKKHFRD